MKIAYGFLVTLVCLVFPHNLMADETAVSPADEAEWQTIRAIKPVYEAAINSSDIEKLKPYVSDKFVGVMLTGDTVKGYQGLSSYYAKMKELIGAGGTHTTKIQYEPGTIIGSVAIAYGTTNDSVTTSAGATYSFTAPWTAVMEKEGQEWKILRIHSSLDPIHNEFVNTFTRKSNETWGAIGFIAGAAILLLAKMLRRA